MRQAARARVMNASASGVPSADEQPTDSDGGGGGEAHADEEPASTSSPPPAKKAEQEAAPQRGFVSKLASAVQKGRSLGWLPMP